MKNKVLNLLTASRLDREIVIVASNVQLRTGMERAIASQGYRRVSAQSASEVLIQSVNPTPDLCVVCVGASGCELAMKVIGLFRQKSPEMKFIIITENANHLTDLSQPNPVNLQVISQPIAMLEFIAAVERALIQ